jgi:hypothetical protein
MTTNPFTSAAMAALIFLLLNLGASLSDIALFGGAAIALPLAARESLDRA